MSSCNCHPGLEVARRSSDHTLAVPHSCTVHRTPHSHSHSHSASIFAGFSRPFLSKITSLRAVCSACVCVSEPRVELGQRRPDQPDSTASGMMLHLSACGGLNQSPPSRSLLFLRVRGNVSARPGNVTPDSDRPTKRCWFGPARQLQLGKELLPAPGGPGSKMDAIVVSIAAHCVYEQATRFSLSFVPDPPATPPILKRASLSSCQYPLLRDLRAAGLVV